MRAKRIYPKRQEFRVVVYGKRTGEIFEKTISARTAPDAISRVMTTIPLDVTTIMIVVDGDVVYPSDVEGVERGRGRAYAFKANTSYNVGVTTARFVRHHVKENIGDFVDSAIRAKLKSDYGVDI